MILGTKDYFQKNEDSSIQESLKLFQSLVDKQKFYELTESILPQLENPDDLAKCAVFVEQREPGGAFYRAKFWTKIANILDINGNERKQKREFLDLCRQVGVNYQRARSYILQGKAIELVEDVSINTENLREVPYVLFQNAQRQKDRAYEYLIEAINVLQENPDAKPSQIHNEWCKKNGNMKSNLDIIKPSDWWAFSHPKWRKEDDFPGSIPGEIYANALYYFAPRRGVAVDPMAGSGMLKRVYDDRGLWQKNSNFDLELYLFDLYPRRSFIKKHDARIRLPIKADWIFIDPPYFGQSNHLFEGEFSETTDYSKYLALMEDVIIAMSDSLNEYGRLCILLPKWSGFRPSDSNYDIPHDVHLIATNTGLKWLDMAFVSRARQQEPASARKNNQAKINRRMRSDTCVLNIFEK